MAEVADVEPREVVADAGIGLDPERDQGRAERGVGQARRVERRRAVEAVWREQVAVVGRHAKRVVARSASRVRASAAGPRTWSSARRSCHAAPKRRGTTWVSEPRA